MISQRIPLTYLIFSLLTFSAHASPPSKVPSEETCIKLQNQKKYQEFQKCLNEFFEHAPKLVADENEVLLSKAHELDIDEDPKKQAQAIEYYLQAAKQGSVEAQVELGQIYIEGTRTTHNLEQSFFWFNKAAEQKSAIGQLFLGKLYQSEELKQKSGQKAIYWLTQSANQNNKFAAELLGDTYKKAILVPQDLSKALKWYQKSVQLGNKSALLQVAVFYANGYGIKKDPTKAEELLNSIISYPPKSEELNMIGQWYEHGENGFPKDTEIAKHWYKQAKELNQSEK